MVAHSYLRQYSHSNRRRKQLEVLMMSLNYTSSQVSSWQMMSLPGGGAFHLSAWWLLSNKHVGCQTNTKYPTMRHIAWDYLATQGSATPSECVFSSGGITGSACRSRLSTEIFEALQILKSAYCNGHAAAACQAGQHIDDLIMGFGDDLEWWDEWLPLVDSPVVCLTIKKLWFTNFGSPVLDSSPSGPELMVQSRVQAKGSNWTQSPVQGSDKIPCKPDWTELWQY